MCEEISTGITVVPTVLTRVEECGRLSVGPRKQP